MAKLELINTELPGVVLLQPQLFNDTRGYFMEVYRQEAFKSLGLPCQFVQENQSGSGKGILRGLHYQIQQAHGKLVRVLVGEVFDVAVDIRRSSPTFKQWVGANLSADNKQQLWIPPGFAHGFYVLSDWAEVTYKVTTYYAPQWNRSIRWDDQDLGINWPISLGEQPILSASDANAPNLTEAEIFD